SARLVRFPADPPGALLPVARLPSLPLPSALSVLLPTHPAVIPSGTGDPRFYESRITNPESRPLELSAIPVAQLLQEATGAPAGPRGPPRMLDLAAHQQQAHAGGMHGVAHHLAQAGGVLRDADAHRHLQHFLGQLDHAFHLRSATGQHHARTHQLLATGAAQLGLDHLEALLVTA